MCVYSLNRFFFTAFKKDRFDQTVDGNRELLEESVPLTVTVNVNSSFPVWFPTPNPETHIVYSFLCTADVVVACSNHGCSVEVFWKDVQGLGEVS